VLRIALQAGWGEGLLYRPGAENPGIPGVPSHDWGVAHGMLDSVSVAQPVAQSNPLNITISRTVRIA